MGAPTRTNQRALFYMQRRMHMNMPKVNTLKRMDMPTIRKSVEVSKKKNLKSRTLWRNYLYVVILKLYNNQVSNYVDLMIILKLLSKQISLEKKVLNFICEKLENHLYRLTIRELSLLMLVLRKHKFDNLYFLNLLAKSILIKMNKNLSYKDLALITFSLSRSISLTEKVYTNEIFHLSVVKIHNDLKSLNFHSLTLFFYSYSLYFLHHFEHFNSFFYMTKNFIQVIKKNIYLLNPTDLMFTFLSAVHICGALNNGKRNVQCERVRLSSGGEIPHTNAVLRKGGSTNNHALTNYSVTHDRTTFVPSKTTPGGKITTGSVPTQALHQTNYTNAKTEQQDGPACEETLSNFLTQVRHAIVEKLKCFKVEEVTNVLFACLDRDFTINKRYFPFLQKDRIHIEDYLHVYVKKGQTWEEEQGEQHAGRGELTHCLVDSVAEDSSNVFPHPTNYIIRVSQDTHQEESFLNALSEEIIYRNEFLTARQILLLLYALRRTNTPFVQLEKILLKRLVCLEKELTISQVMFVYQYLYFRTCLFNELRRYAPKVYKQDRQKKEVFLLCDGDRSTRETDERANQPADQPTLPSERSRDKDNQVYYLHDDTSHLKKRRKRDKTKIFLYDNFIFKYPAEVSIEGEEVTNLQEKKIIKKFISVNRRGDTLAEVNGLSVTHDRDEVPTGEAEYQVTCYNFYLDVYKIVCLKMVNSLKNEKLTTHTIMHILEIFKKLNIRDYRIIRHLYKMEKDILFLDNSSLEKVLKILLKFNLYNMMHYLGVHRILQFINFNSVDECVSILGHLGMLSTRRKTDQAFANFPNACTENAVNYILKNLTDLSNTHELEKLQITPLYNSLPLKYFKLFKNVRSVRGLAQLFFQQSGQKKNHLAWSGENGQKKASNFVLHCVDDVNLGEVSLGSLSCGSATPLTNCLHEYRDLQEEIFQELHTIFPCTIEVYKNVNVSNYTFPLAINLLTLGGGAPNTANQASAIDSANAIDSAKTHSLGSQGRTDGPKRTQELDRRNTLLVDILYGHDFYYSLTGTKEQQLKKHNIYVAYYGMHAKKANKKMVNYKKHVILKCVKKIGYNFICIDAKRYVKNKKKNRDNHLNKGYLTSLILDLIKRKKRIPLGINRRVSGKNSSGTSSQRRRRRSLLREKRRTSSIEGVVSHVGTNKHLSKMHAEGEKTIFPGTNHLDKLRHMFQLG
ncbi:Der1-like protein [Plasmodium coatneyi]|uniref:Der1-like protein n=1 Tax=Plasmodium coatneyi TaxID=208452 RepID=A0A1B1DYS2_9APIC|nr:Der1-like protein [Plasmodium coatneyi]ANQ07769.1 Der1-like protein [Plasmodium coatneyi]